MSEGKIEEEGGVVPPPMCNAKHPTLYLIGTDRLVPCERAVHSPEVKHEALIRVVWES